MITYPVPSAEILSLGRVEAIRAYKLLEVTLLDGTEVRPNLRTAKLILDGARSGLLIPVVVTEGSYTVVDREAEARYAEAAVRKQERFEMFMAEDGITENPRAEEGRCSGCGESGTGKMHYAPDAMGWPTQVLFISDCCNAS